MTKRTVPPGWKAALLPVTFAALLSTTNAVTSTAESYVVSATARSEGVAGASWRSTARVVNVGTGSVSATVTFLPRDVENSNPTWVFTFSLMPGQMSSWDDVMLEMFGLDEGAGSLHFDTDGPVLVATRTFNDAPEGTYGQLIRGVNIVDADPPETAIYLLGLVENDVLRSNLGLVNLTDSDIAVTITVYDSNGSELDSWVEGLLPRMYRQRTQVLSARGLAPVDSAYAVLTSTGAFLSYVSQVDMGTNDPIYRYGRQVNLAEEVYIPAAAREAGAEGSSWVTDGVALNSTGSASTLRLAMWPRDVSSVSPETRDLTLAAGEQVIISDMLGSLFGLDQGAAALSITNATGILIDSRTYNLTERGTYGQYIPACTAGEALASGDLGHLLLATENAAFRTNLTLVNLAAEQAQVKVSAYRPDVDDDQLIGEHVWDIAPYTYIQPNRVLDTLAGDTVVDRAYLTIEVISDAGMILAGGSMVDNSSNDPVYEPARKVVAGVNGPPDFTALEVDSTGNLGDDVVIRFAATDPDGDELTVTVTLDGEAGGAVVFHGVSETPTELIHVFPTVGEHSIDLALSDGVHPEVVETRTVTVADRPTVNLRVSEQDVLLGESFTLTVWHWGADDVGLSGPDGFHVVVPGSQSPFRVETSLESRGVSTFTATATASGRTLTDAVDVEAWPEASVAALTDENQVCPGSSTTLRWSTKNATEVRVNGTTVPGPRGSTEVGAGTWAVEALNPADTATETGSVSELACNQAACDSLYAAAVAEATTCGCDTIFESDPGCTRPSSLDPNTTLCRDSETPNSCYRRLYDDAESAVGFQPWTPLPRAHVGKYLPICADGTDGPCPGAEVRCYDGTRPLVYAQKAHADDQHTPMLSDTWVISMGGEGGPCGGEVSANNPANCWLRYYIQAGAFRESLSTKTPWKAPPESHRTRGGIQEDRLEFNGRDNPFHLANRVFFERCGELASDGEEIIHPVFEGAAVHAGATPVYHHGHATAAALFNYLTTDRGRDLGGGNDTPPDGDANDPEDLPSLADARLILITGGSDAAKWLILGADALAAELAMLAPDATVKVVFDSIIGPMLENEYRAQYPYSSDLDGNANGVNDVYDNIVGNPNGYLVPHASAGDDPYGVTTYSEGGNQRVSLGRFMVPLDTSCVAAHSSDPSLCYETAHVAFNHVAAPFAVLMDLTDGVVRSSAWDGTTNDWLDVDYAPRIQSQGIDLAMYSEAHSGCGDATITSYTPALWMPSRGAHTHMLAGVRLEGKMFLCDSSSQPVYRRDLATAIYEWLEDITTIDAVAGYQRADGLTWYDKQACTD